MFKDFIKFGDFDGNYIDNTDFKLIKQYKFGPRYFLGDAVFEVKNNRLLFVKGATGNEISNIEKFPYEQGEYNFYFEPRDLTQVFHALVYGIVRIVPLAHDLPNINVYMPKNVHDGIFQKNDDGSYKYAFAEYIDLLPVNKINFIPIDIKNLKSQFYYIKNYVLVHIPSKHGICKETIDILTTNVKDLAMPEGISDKVYLSRNDNKYARVPLNEEKFAEYFKDLGFTTLDLADYKIVDQIAIVRNAKIIAGWSGSCFSNIFFSENNKIAIDFTYLPDKTFYEKNVKLEDLEDATAGRIESLMNRYDFDWSILIAQTNATYVKINFEKIDTCEQAIEILDKNIWFKKIIS